MNSFLSGETVTGLGGNALADYVRDGTVRVIASGGRAPSAVFPGAPTIAETYPGFEAQAWMALFAPAGVAPEMLQRLRVEMRGLLLEQEAAGKIRNSSGFDVLAAEPAVFTVRMLAEHERYGETVKQVGLAID